MLESEPQYQTALSRTQEFARSLGIVPDERFYAACADWLRCTSLAPFLQPLPNATEIARGWQSCLKAGDSTRDDVRVFVFILFRELLSSRAPNAHAVDQRLRALYDGTMPRLNLTGSWFEASRRLLAALYHLGRLGEP